MKTRHAGVSLAISAGYNSKERPTIMNDNSKVKLPQGIEVLVKKASLDPVFNAILLRRRADAAREIGLELTPEETQMLNGVPQDHLDAVISQVAVHPLLRPIFLGKDGPKMVKSLSAEIVRGGLYETRCGGIRPE